MQRSLIHLHWSAVRIQKTRRHGNTPLHQKTMQQDGDSPDQAVVQEPKHQRIITIPIRDKSVSLFPTLSLFSVTYNISYFQFSPIMSQNLNLNLFLSIQLTSNRPLQSLKKEMYFKIQWLWYIFECSFETWDKKANQI